jgi:long-subunit fatty acid transport protein
MGVLLLAGLPALAGAAQEFEKVGTIGGQFLKIGIGARATAMGSAFVSVADDASAIYWNPAGVARVSKNVATINHAAWLADTSFTQAAYLLPRRFSGTSRSTRGASTWTPADSRRVPSRRDWNELRCGRPGLRRHLRPLAHR